MQASVRYTLLGVVLAGAIALTPFRPLKVAGRSMEPTLQNGQTLLLDQFYWRAGGLRRSDIVVVDRGDERWVKRLVGMPGDTVQVTATPEGWITNVSNLTVNPALQTRGVGVEERKLAPDEIFVIGDNLNQSADSTTQEAGAFKLRDVIGVVRTFSMKREFPFRERS